MAYPTVEISGVTKTFGPTVALGGCNLRAYAREVHAIIGGNGSGKSTLAKVISGVLVPDSGQVSILGKSATSPYEARRLGISNVFQEVLVADECSVLDNLYLGSDGLFAAALHHEEKVARASTLMRELLGYDIDLSTPAGELPLSIKQWITIGRALLTEPRVLILDESSAALDFDSTERLFAKMRQLKKAGTSILIVTHRIAELVRIADRATVLRDGVDVGCLGKAEITEARILELIAGPEREREQAADPVVPPPDTSPVLRAAGLRIWEDAAPVDFLLCPGEIVGVTGLDGHGQSGFVRCLAGIDRPVAGQVTALRGKDAAPVSDLRSARDNKISYVSGDRKKEGIFANLSIDENLLIPVYGEYRVGGFLNFLDRAKLTPIFEWESGKLAVKMGDRHNAITSLSGGNQQKVLIARAFAEQPAVLVLNDPARGIDVGAKLDLYRNLREFAARGNAVVFLSSELEEFISLCSRVLVFRHGSIASEFTPPYDGHVLLNAMFGRKATARLPGEAAAGIADADDGDAPRRRPPVRFEDGRPMPRPVLARSRPVTEADTGDFMLEAPDIAPGQVIPARFAEDRKVSPRLVWRGVPKSTRSFALSVTDPDLPEEFNFPRAFAHWLVHDIPASCRELPEGASGTALMPPGARELNSDFVTFGIPGFGRGYGGPWPPDRQHRYVFTLYALKAATLDIAPDADLPAFAAAVMPAAIDMASFVAVYGPAKKPLPS